MLATTTAVCFLLTLELWIGVLLTALAPLFNLVKSLLPKPLRDLTGDVVLVVGASSSLGESLAKEFAKHGCCVICLDEDSTALGETVARLKDRCRNASRAKLGSKREHSFHSTDSMISSYTCDLSASNDIRRTAQKVKRDFGRVDVLITCIADVGQHVFTATSRTLSTHFWTVLAFLPMMLCRGRAHIVGVTPVATNGDGQYGSRAAVACLVESLARHLGEHATHLTLLAFSPTANHTSERNSSTNLKESEKRVARDIVQAVRSDDQDDSSWTRRLLCEASSLACNLTGLLGRWIYSQRRCSYEHSC